jgi:hypothetical protein
MWIECIMWEEKQIFLLSKGLLVYINKSGNASLFKLYITIKPTWHRHTASKLNQTENRVSHWSDVHPPTVSLTFLFSTTMDQCAHVPVQHCHHRASLIQYNRVRLWWTWKPINVIYDIVRYHDVLVNDSIRVLYWLTDWAVHTTKIDVGGKLKLSFRDIYTYIICRHVAQYIEDICIGEQGWMQLIERFCNVLCCCNDYVWVTDWERTHCMC